MFKKKMKRTLAGMLAGIMTFTSSGLSGIGPVYASEVLDTYPVNFGLTWDDTTVDSTTEIDGNTMTLTPYSDADRDTTGGTTAKLVLDYTLGSEDAGDGTMVPLTAEAGDVEIRLPAYIFKDRNGNAVGRHYLGIGLQKDSDTGFYYMVDTKDTDELNDDEIVIKNYATFTGDQTFRCNITYWSGQAHNIADGYPEAFHASSTVREGSLIKYQKNSNELKVVYKTTTEIEKINPVSGNIAYPKLYKNWKDSWGTKPSGLTDYSADKKNGYFYVAWPVTTVFAQWPTQPGTLNEMTCDITTDGNTVSDVVAATVESYTFPHTASLPTKAEDLDEYQSGYIVTAHKVSEFETSGKDTICITADIKTSFTGLDGCTSGAGIIQTYNYDSLSRTGGGGTFIPYDYAPAPEEDDESDGFISLLHVSDFGEVLPLKSMTQPNKTAENTWDFVITGEASNAYELTAGYVEEEEAETTSYKMKRPATDTGSSSETEGSEESKAVNDINDSTKETSAEESKGAETSDKPLADTPAEKGLLDKVLDIQDADAETGTKTYGVNHYTMELTDDLFILEGEDLKAGDYQFDNIPYIKIQGIAAQEEMDEPDVTINAGTGEWTVDGSETLTWKPGGVAIEGLTLYYKKGNGKWTKYDYVKHNGELAGAGINGVTAIKAEYKSNYGYTAVQVFTNVYLVKTKHVMDIIGDKSSVTLWNVDSMRSYNSAGHLLTAHDVNKYGGTLKEHLVARDEAYKAEDAAAANTEAMKNGILNGALIQQHDFDYIELTKAYLESKATKSVAYTNNTSAERVEANYTLEAYLEGKSDYKSVLSAIVTRQKHDTFYDLLPKGMSYVKNSVTANLIGQTSVYADVEVEQISNWKDTGRTMLIFHVNIKDGQSNYNNYRSGYTLKFKACYPWEDIQEYGRTPRNSFAYKSGEGDFKGFADDGGRIYEGALFAELDGIESDVRDTVYADVNESLIWNTASVNGFSKRVKTPDDEGWSSETFVYEGQDYSYRLRYGSESGTTSEGIILYDVLENNHGEKDYWKGTLKSVDTSSAEEKGIQPVVYYSTKEGIQFENSSAPDLTDETVWSRTMPADLGKVTAVAVDLSAKQDGTTFVLEENAAISVVINMTAPNDGVDEYLDEILAYNTSWIKTTTKNTASTTETTAFTQSDATRVGIKAPMVAVFKVNDGGPEEDEFELTLNVTNASANTEYPVQLNDGSMDILKTDADGKGSYTGILKGEEGFFVMLPYGAKYTVSEDPENNYKASYKVQSVKDWMESMEVGTMGDAINDDPVNIASPFGSAVDGGEALSTKEETVDETGDVVVTFTNDIRERSIEVWKRIDGRYENRSDHKFNFKLDVTGKPGDKCRVTLPDGTPDEFMIGLNGKASYDFTLTGSEVRAGAEVFTVALPIGTTYQVTEFADEAYSSDYDPKFYIGTSGSIAQKSGTGEPGKDLSTAVETVDEEDAKTLTVKFTNTGVTSDLHIEKEVTGTAANKNESFEYIVHFTGLDAGKTYELDGYQYEDYPEETPEGVTMFLPGQAFNDTIDAFCKRTFSSFVRSADAPAEGVNTVIVSTDDSEHEIVAWIDNSTLYWYSGAQKVCLNYDATNMFDYCSVLTNISGLTDVDTSYTINMRGLFYQCEKLSDITSLTDWDVSGVKDMDGAFTYCANLSDITPLAGWDVSSVTNMDSVFNSTKITNVNALARWDVSNVTSMYFMFGHCRSLADISGLANWKVDNITDMSLLFYNCRALANISPLEKWDVSSVTDMKHMFYYAKITNVDALADWNVSNVSDMTGMFEYCQSLTDISGLADWDVSSVTDMSNTFHYCLKVTSISPLKNWDVSNVTNMTKMFRYTGYRVITNINALASWDVSNVEDMSEIFEGLEKLTGVSALKSWDVSSVTNMSSMFNCCYKLSDISGLANWDVSNVEDMSIMFWECSSLADISPLANWNTGSVTNMGQMFDDCPSLSDISALKNWNVSSVIKMTGAFRSTKITNTDALSRWDVSSVEMLNFMFENCTYLVDISGLANWNISSVTDAREVFYGCTSLTDASVLSGWNAGNVQLGLTHGNQGAFDGCTLLEEHPSKFPTWYSAYRSAAVTTGTEKISTINLISLDETGFLSPMLLLNVPENENSNDVVFDHNDYSTVNAAKHHADSGRFVADANGEAYYSFHLKHGAFIDINDLNPGVQYEIIEEGNSYLPSYSVIKGNECTVSDKGRNETPGDDLSTGVETLSGGNDISYLFTNTKDAGHNITVTKKVDGKLANITDQFHYTADLGGLEAGEKYTIKKSTAPVSELEGAFDFSKYTPKKFDLTEDLIEELAGYAYIGEWNTCIFDNKGSGLGIANDWGFREEGYDSINIYADTYGDYCIYFYNSSTDNSCSIYIEESHISAFPLTNAEGETKTIDLSAYMADIYTKVSEEDLQTLDEAVFELKDGSESDTYNFKVIEDRLHVTHIHAVTENGRKIESEPVIYTGDSLYLYTYYGVELFIKDSSNASDTGESMGYFPTDSTPYYKKAAVETISFTADADGNAVLRWDMKADDTYEIMGLPEGATYQIKEDASEKYIASYTVSDNNDSDGIPNTVEKVSDTNLLKNKDLTTAEETVDLYEDVVITFTNNAPMPVLPQTGSSTALLFTLIGFFGIAGYSIFEIISNRKKLGIN